MITLPRPMLVSIMVGFSLLCLALGVYSLLTEVYLPDRRWRVVVAMVLYLAAVVASVWIGRTVAMPLWLAALDVGVSLSIALLVSSALPQQNGSYGYGTWYIGALGALLTTIAVRRHSWLAWFGLGLLTAQTVVVFGWGAILAFGVIGNLIWIAVAHMFTRALVRATLDVHQFARAEREALEWQAAQDAHHFERQVRVAQTSRMALPMLERVIAHDGDLGAADRYECRVLEQSIRDEIRGRRLLNDAVREQVIAARRRGAFVQVLDDGGVDDIDPQDLDPVLDQVAAALASVRSDRLIIRTAPRGSTKAVTVVGISVSEEAAALGLDDDDEQVDLWLELERPAGAPAPVPA